MHAGGAVFVLSQKKFFLLLSLLFWLFECVFTLIQLPFIGSTVLTINKSCKSGLRDIACRESEREIEKIRWMKSMKHKIHTRTTKLSV